MWKDGKPKFILIQPTKVDLLKLHSEKNYMSYTPQSCPTSKSFENTIYIQLAAAADLSSTFYFASSFIQVQRSLEDNVTPLMRRSIVRRLVSKETSACHAGVATPRFATVLLRGATYRKVCVLDFLF